MNNENAKATPITHKYAGIAVSHPHFAPMVNDMFRLERELAAKDAELNKFWGDLMEALGDEGHDELRPDGTFDSLKTVVESVRTAVSDLAASRADNAKMREALELANRCARFNPNTEVCRIVNAALAQKAGGTPQPSKEVFQEMQKLRAEFAQGGGE